jgi:hypothetical protein
MAPQRRTRMRRIECEVRTPGGWESCEDQVRHSRSAQMRRQIFNAGVTTTGHDRSSRN